MATPKQYSALFRQPRAPRQDISKVEDKVAPTLAPEDEWVTVEKKEKKKPRPFIATTHPDHPRNKIKRDDVIVFSADDAKKNKRREEQRKGSKEVDPNAKKNADYYDGRRMYKVDSAHDATEFEVDHVSHSLALTISQERAKLGMTQAELARQTNLTQSVIQSWEGARAVFDVITMNKISSVLKVPLRK